MPPTHTTPRPGFVVAGGDGYWIVHLAEALSGFVPTMLLSNPQVRGWLKPRLKGLRHARALPIPADPRQWREQTICVPSAFRRPVLGPFRGFVEWPVERAVRSWSREQGVEPWLLLPYPWLKPFYRSVPAARTIYYNFDDYRLYDRRHAAQLERDEYTLVAECQLTLCSSRAQVDRFRAAVPEAAERVLHFPHGTLERVLHEAPAGRDQRTIGYLGNLGDRIDWRLVRDVARQLPEAQFEFVGDEIGKPEGGTVEQWRLDREAVRQLPNVRFSAFVPHERIHEKYRSFSVSWMPYAVNHAFNRAASPTKLMDTFAAGRPLVSTPVPEALIYPGLVASAADADGLIAHLRELLDAGGAERTQREARIREFAAVNTWRHRARYVLEQCGLTPAVPAAAP